MSERQCCVLHLHELADGSVGLTVIFHPPIESKDDAHVPGEVEAIARRMVAAAEQAPALTGPVIDVLPWERRS